MKATTIGNLLIGITASSIIIAIALFGLTVGYSLKPDTDILPWQHSLFRPAIGCLIAGLVTLFFLNPKPEYS